MIIITNRAAEIAEWIEANCAEPSRYTISGSWPADVLDRTSAPVEIVLHLTPTDQMLLDLYHAGWFMRHPHRDRWHDDTPLNRELIGMMAIVAEFNMVISDRFKQFGIFPDNAFN